MLSEVLRHRLDKRARYRGAKAVFCEKEALLATMKEYPPDPVAEAKVKLFRDTDKRQKLLKNEIVKLKAKRMEEDEYVKEEKRREKNRLDYVVRQLRDKEDTQLDNLPSSVAWALNHVHLIGDPFDPSTWNVQPSQAPSTAAWNMLIYACEDRKGFMSKTISEMIAIKKREIDKAERIEIEKMKAEMARAEEEENDPDALAGQERLDDIRELLRNMGSGTTTQAGEDNVDRPRRKTAN